MLGERAPHRAAEEVFCAARTGPAMKGLGCVSGEEAHAVSIPPDMTMGVTQEIV